jgi:hypothetical protein
MGIPLVAMIYDDQDQCFANAARVSGVPGLRRVHVSRTRSGEEDAMRAVQPLFDALTRPLMPKEQERGTWVEPDKRILFEGTLQEAQEFYQQTEIIPTMQNAPFAKYSDGLPIIVPTEELVEKMLKGTSHKPDEVITFQSEHFFGNRIQDTQAAGGRESNRSVMMGNTGIKGDPVKYLPMRRRATVEKVATIAVMAGCKPEYLPVVLALAESGGGCGDGRGRSGFCVSGPIAKEIGMNFDINIFGPGNHANRSIGRTGDLMWRNFGGEIPTVTNCGIWGSGLTNVVPENVEANPPGWLSLAEEYDFKRSDSVLVQVSPGGRGGDFSPGGYRALQKSGHGGIARRLGVKGKPGPHNWLEYIIPGMWDNREGGVTIFMLPHMARHLYDYGFKTKDDIYEWLYRKSFAKLGEYQTHSWADIRTGGWMGRERQSGKHWKELPDDYMVPLMEDPFENCVIVTGGGEESMLHGGGRPGGDSAYSIDAWR